MKCLSTGIGSVPYKNPEKACNFVLKYFKEIPFWPQLPKKDFLEGMNIQFTEHLPGKIEDKSFKLIEDLDEITKFYEKFLDGYNNFRLTKEYAAGFNKFIKKEIKSEAIKGQITGAITFGMSTLSKEKIPLLFDRNLKELIIQNTVVCGKYQVKTLEKLSDKVLLFIDEPYLSVYGKPIFNLGKKEIIDILNTEFHGIKESSNHLIGSHCCENTDWSLFTDSLADIIAFDAYNFSKSFILYDKEIKYFLKRGGIIAFGITPTYITYEIDKEDINSLENKFEEVLDLFKNKGIDKELLLNQALITPTCGFGLQTFNKAHKIAKLTQELSYRIREKYNLK